jgi:hypothetical protein
MEEWVASNGGGNSDSRHCIENGGVEYWSDGVVAEQRQRRRQRNPPLCAGRTTAPVSRLHWLPQAVPPTAGEYRALSAGRDFRKGGRGDGEGQSGIGIRYSVAEVGKERDSLC